MQRWALLLAAYRHDIELWSTKEHSNADGFSWLPQKTNEGVESVSALSPFNLSQIEFLPVDAEKLRRATGSDPVLSKEIHKEMARRNWGNLKPHANQRDELTVEAGCLLWGMSVLISEYAKRLCWRNCTLATQGWCRLHGSMSGGYQLTSDWTDGSRMSVLSEGMKQSSQCLTAFPVMAWQSLETDTYQFCWPIYGIFVHDYCQCSLQMPGSHSY